MCYKDEIDRQATVKKPSARTEQFKLEIDEDMSPVYHNEADRSPPPNFPLKKWKERKKRNRDKKIIKKVDGKLLRTDKQFRTF